jgi:3-hydroxyisobutyrate dehydrogenase-like beta-hydroxyacid dehydrogenase
MFANDCTERENAMADSLASSLSVGWIGTGRMGTPLVSRLADAGLDVAAWNRTRSRAEPLTARGVTVVDTLGDLAERDVVFTMVSADDDLEEVVRGLLAGGKGPGVLVDCSTVSATASGRVREAAAAAGVAFLAAPVSGNGKVVTVGQLSLVCSGPEDAFDRVRPVLELLGRHVTYVGEGELSRLVKICHNLLLGVVSQSLAEITVLAEKSGVSRAAFLDFINNSVMGSVFTRYKAPALVHLDYTPTFTPVLLRKDFDLGLRAADEVGVPMPVAAVAREAVQAAIAQGHDAKDFAVLLEVQAAASGLSMSPEDVEVDDGLGPDAG